MMVDKNNWVLRKMLVSDGLSATIVKGQRCHPLLKASIMITALKVNNRIEIEKFRLTNVTAGEISTVNVRRYEATAHGAFEDVVTTPWRYFTEYDKQASPSDYTSLAHQGPSMGYTRISYGRVRATIHTKLNIIQSILFNQN